MRHFAIDVDVSTSRLPPPPTSRRSWFVRRIPHIETRAVWRRERGLPRPQTPLSHFRTDIQRGQGIGLVCYAKPQAGFRTPKSDLGFPRENEALCDRCRRRHVESATSGGLAPLVVCQTHATHRNQGAVATREGLVEATD